MEKLIELLNEREVGEEWWELYYLSNGIIRDDWWNILYSYRIISKEFWFIKWLVENDKIDLNSHKTVYSWDLDKRKTLMMSSGWDEFYQVTEHWVYESLLMLLSISNSPIEDLISYLK